MEIRSKLKYISYNMDNFFLVTMATIILCK